jgi:hypothetical protein
LHSRRFIAGQWVETLRKWWSDRTAITQLGAIEPEKREAAIQALVNRGASTIPVLVRALYASPVVACGAAEALDKLGADVGIQTVLVRCYDEEWLSEHPFRSVNLGALRRLGHDGIGSAFEAGLVGAPAERDLHRCFDRLTLSLSALRLLHEYGCASPLEWWERGLVFGHRSLTRIQSHPFAALAYGLTDRIRAAALRGLLTQYPQEAFGACERGLKTDDVGVMRTAIAGMSRLLDVRALPLLQPIAFSAHHPLALESRKAIENIAGTEAESLTLMRSSHADANVTVHFDLVRPADCGEAETADLLRSAVG